MKFLTLPDLLWFSAHVRLNSGYNPPEDQDVATLAVPANVIITAFNHPKQPYCLPEINFTEHKKTFSTVWTGALNNRCTKIVTKLML